MCVLKSSSERRILESSRNIIYSNLKDWLIKR